MTRTQLQVGFGGLDGGVLAIGAHCLLTS